VTGREPRCSPVTGKACGNVSGNGRRGPAATDCGVPGQPAWRRPADPAGGGPRPSPGTVCAGQRIPAAGPPGAGDSAPRPRAPPGRASRCGPCGGPRTARITHRQHGARARVPGQRGTAAVPAVRARPAGRETGRSFRYWPPAIAPGYLRAHPDIGVLSRACNGFRYPANHIGTARPGRCGAPRRPPAAVAPAGRPPAGTASWPVGPAAAVTGRSLIAMFPARSVTAVISLRRRASTAGKHGRPRAANRRQIKSD
jgi:hypothetical protein